MSGSAWAEEFIDEGDERMQAHLALRRAVVCGNAPEVARLLKGEALIDQFDGFGRTAAMDAAIGGQAECLAALARAGADLSEVDVDGRQAIALAAIHGQAACVAALAAGGANVDQVDPLGLSPAMWAAMHGHEKCLRALIAAGARMDEGYQPGSKTTMIASSAKGGGLHFLISQGAGLMDDTRECVGWTPAMVAAHKGFPECVELLAEAGCDISAKTADGLGVAQIAAAAGHMACALQIEAMVERQALDESVGDSDSKGAPLRV